MAGGMGELLIYPIIIVIGFIIPAVLTGWNIYNCVSEKPKWEKLIPCLTLCIGGVLYMFLHVLSFDMAGEWYEVVNSMQYHNAISSEYALLDLIVLIGLAAYLILLFVRADKMPPLISAILISFLIIMNVIHIAYAMQLSKHVDGMELMLYVYHLNILILSAGVIRKHMREMAELFKSRAADGAVSGKKFISKMDSISKYSFFIFVVLFFVVAVLEIIFVMMGQGLDAPIKAFTETADWTFSQQIPPPPAEYDGHYLCTVAAGGHKRIVKPLRLGTRRDQTIVVNRQLCIANAFEEVIQEKMPRVHGRIRYVYDNYGYPLSRVITSPARADFVYFVMKPLEWIFLVFLYLVDLRPEQRIARQYTYKEV